MREGWGVGCRLLLFTCEFFYIKTFSNPQSFLSSPKLEFQNIQDWTSNSGRSDGLSIKGSRLHLLAEPRLGILEQTEGVPPSERIAWTSKLAFQRPPNSKWDEPLFLTAFRDNNDFLEWKELRKVNGEKPSFFSHSMQFGQGNKTNRVFFHLPQKLLQFLLMSNGF